MALFNFKPQFVDSIIDGTKGGTIRAYRKYPVKVGDTMYLYTGLRSAHAKKLLEVPCIEYYDIEIESKCVTLFGNVNHNNFFLFDEPILNKFAIGDGFANWNDMCAFWKGESFKGFHARWKPMKELLPELYDW
ncbi:MAG: hypothetical protein ACRC1W_01260 [Shewanella sp.]